MQKYNVGNLRLQKEEVRSVLWGVIWWVVFKSYDLKVLYVYECVTKKAASWCNDERVYMYVCDGNQPPETYHACLPYLVVEKTQFLSLKKWKQTYTQGQLVHRYTLNTVMYITGIQSQSLWNHPHKPWIRASLHTFFFCLIITRLMFSRQSAENKALHT